MWVWVCGCARAHAYVCVRASFGVLEWISANILGLSFIRGPSIFSVAGSSVLTSSFAPSSLAPFLSLALSLSPFSEGVAGFGRLASAEPI